MEMALMIQDDTCVQTLIELGLTRLQAKTYLALATFGKANVKTISKSSSVARQDIYRIMSALQKLGLAEKIIAKPTIYKATPIKEGLSILLQKRKEKIAELQKKTSSLLDTFQANNAEIALQEGSMQFMVTSEISLLHKMHKKLTGAAQTSIDIVIPLNFVEVMLSNESRCFKRAIRRGAKMRILAQKTEGETMPRKPQALAEKPFFELKYLYTPDQLGMHIFDRKEVTLCVSEKGGVPSLWSSNSNIVKLATNYFDCMWNKAEES